MGKQVYFLKTLIIAAILLLFQGCAPGKFAYKRGEKKIEQGEYQLAIEKFYEAIAKDYRTGDAYYFIGESYRMSNRIDEALEYYQKAVSRKAVEEDAYLRYSEALQANGEYEKALDVLEDYLDNATDEAVIEKANFRLQSLQTFLDEVVNKKTYFRIKPLDELNTTFGEFAPVYNNGKIYFSSNRGNEAIYNATGTPYYNIYGVNSRGANVDLSTLAPLEGIINEPDIHEGPATFTPDGRTMVFAKSNTGKRKGRKEVSLYVSVLRRSGWSTPRLIRVNDPEAWDSTPTFSTDGRTLYFASNREGGFGGTDIYLASSDGRGRFGSVRNAGPEINTPGNELFPFYGEDGKLYFASDGHPGFGKLDIFSAYRTGAHLEVENLGQPLNSKDDDFGLFLFKVDRGFFCSNRPSGKGDDDIYTFVNEDPDLKVVNYFITGNTMTPSEELDSIIPLGNTTVTLFASSTNEVLSQTQTGLNGSFEFRLFEDEDYFLVGEKDGYFTTRVPYSMFGKAVKKDTLKELVTNVYYDTLINMDLIVLDKIIVLENIYYDFDRAFIRDDAAKELDKLIAVMKDNASIKIELSSHTDARAPDDYNMALSQRRADSAVSYMIKKGIAPDRIVAKGYGETKLIIENAQTEEEHQVNRRTEFKVIAFVGTQPTTIVGSSDSLTNTGNRDDRYFNDDDRFFDNSP